MPTAIQNRSPSVNPVSAPAPTPTTPAPETVEDMTQPAPAASFEGVSGKRHVPFGPPPSPTLLDESKPAALEENRARIGAYNEAYRAYLERYQSAVESAPDLERVRAFGPPAAYEPVSSLPVAQRARYDELHKPSLANAVEVRKAIGERELKEQGIRTPDAYAFVEGKVSYFGQSLKKRAEVNSDGEVKGKDEVAFSVSSPVDIGPLKKPKVTHKIDMESGEHKTAVSTKVGSDSAFIGVELDDHGKLQTEFGVGSGGSAFGEELKAAASVGTSWDPSSARAEVFTKGTAKVGDFLEVEGRAGAGVQLLTKKYVKAVVDPADKDFFDVQALRTGGR